MDTTTTGPAEEGEQPKDSMQVVVVEALPDIESADAHTLGVVAGVKGKETEAENEESDDGTSENESDGDGERGVKRVKLDNEGDETIATATQEQAEAASSNNADGAGEEKVAEEEDETFELRMTWAGQGFDLRVQGSDRLYDFKAMIYSLTAVPPDRQKLIGLVRGKIPGDETCFKDLPLSGSGVRKFACIGTPQEMTFKDPSEMDPKNLPDVMDDFDVSYREQAVKPADDARNQRRVQQRIDTCQIDIMNEPRPGKALLVLDLDYTIVDTEPLLKGSLPTAQCLRPGLHEFLEKAYESYDIAVWSQTHWRWLESKLVEMGMIGDLTRNYKIFGTRAGKAYKHE
ncbi:hypothetical protein QFC21_007224 [Naganishia friedmannii]|uniref:Uncharacterized protein n=1 Tax=Naganishia friedmannii TaxID=89922 RepID=A0ACC2UWI4_9TREE|nr:hypothetical protein QFC21_007224 [Naganishia friedmannii]